MYIFLPKLNKYKYKNKIKMYVIFFHLVFKVLTFPINNA